MAYIMATTVFSVASAFIATTAEAEMVDPANNYPTRQNLVSVTSRSLGGYPRIENLLRKSPFGQISRSFSLNSHHYSPQMIEKSDSKWLSLATASILGQPPS